MSLPGKRAYTSAVQCEFELTRGPDTTPRGTSGVRAEVHFDRSNDGVFSRGRGRPILEVELEGFPQIRQGLLHGYTLAGHVNLDALGDVEGTLLSNDRREDHYRTVARDPAPKPTTGSAMTWVRGPQGSPEPRRIHPKGPSRASHPRIVDHPRALREARLTRTPPSGAGMVRPFLA
jgi:hypothetical protein